MTSIITRRRFNFGAGASAAALPLLGTGARAQAPLGVGFIYVGPIGDHGWTWTHDQGRLALEKEYGAKIKTSFIEKVAEGPDAARAIRQLAQAGNQLIFTTSFGFMNPTIQVAKQFPKLKFEHATGYQRAENVATYNARFYEGRAVIGTIAGHMSKSGQAGYIASFPIPEVVMGINAFTLAARKVNPNFRTKVIWASTWYDPAKEADAAKALIDQMSARGAAVPIAVDVVVGKQFDANEPAVLKDAGDVAADEMIFDIGPKSAEELAEIIMNAATVVWNGPVGVFEFDQFGEGTKRIAQAIAETKAFTLAGGGDTIAAIQKYDIYDKVSYISTAGGAFLEFLEGKPLPAVEILEARARG